MRSKYEIKAQKILEADNWLVDWKVRPHRVPRGYQTDYFSRFDLLAYKDGFLRWIAIKGHQGVPETLRKKIEEFELPAGNQKEIWCFRKKKPIKVEIIK